MSDFKPDLIDLVFKELNSKDRFFFLIGIFISVFTDFLSQQSQQEHLFFFFVHYIVVIHLKATKRGPATIS